MAIHLTQRDLHILVALHFSRYLTTTQIQALFWRESRGGKFGQKKACERRMRMLTAATLVRRIEQPVRRAEPNKPYIYALDKKGAEILIAELGLKPQDVDWRPKNDETNYPFIHHLLATTDVRIALLHACERQELQLEEWIDERELKGEGMKDYVLFEGAGGKRQRAAIVPDAYCTIQAGERKTSLFWEIDRRTVTLQPTQAERRGWDRKVRAYRAYFDSDVYHQRYGNRPIRVMTVTSGAKRMHNLKQVTEDAGGLRLFWFTIFDDATSEKILSKPIWSVAGAAERFSLLGS